MRNFFEKYKKESVIFGVCLFVKLLFFFIILFFYFQRGGWGWINSSSISVPAENIFADGKPLLNFYEPGDWHPPLYYFFAASILSVLPYEWVIFLIQAILVSFAAVFVYKIGKLIFNEKTGFWSGILFGVEPYLSFETNLLSADILSVFIFTLFVYFFVKYLKFFFRPSESPGLSDSPIRFLILSSVFLGLNTLARPTTLYLPVIIIAFLLAASILKRFSLFLFLKHSFIFVAVFLLFIIPWMARNKALYDDFTFSRITRTNFYLYNAPTLLAVKEGISFGEAGKILIEKADREIEESGEDWLDYYEREGFRIILSEPFLYAKIHLIKTIPFFLQPGYEVMLSAYGFPYKTDRPDFTLLFLKGNLSEARKFLSSVDLPLIFYTIGLIFWTAVNALFLLSLWRSLRHDRNMLVYIALFAAIAVYYGLIFGTIAMARYRLPIYPLFFLPAVYALAASRKTK